jgi:hypothetical protein
LAKSDKAQEKQSEVIDIHSTESDKTGVAGALES